MADTGLHSRLNEALVFAARACREERVLRDFDAAQEFFKAERGPVPG